MDVEAKLEDTKDEIKVSSEAQLLRTYFNTSILSKPAKQSQILFKRREIRTMHKNIQSFTRSKELKEYSPSAYDKEKVKQPNVNIVTNKLIHRVNSLELLSIQRDISKRLSTSLSSKEELKKVKVTDNELLGAKNNKEQESLKEELRYEEQISNINAPINNKTKPIENTAEKNTTQYKVILN